VINWTFVTAECATDGRGRRSNSIAADFFNGIGQKQVRLLRHRSLGFPFGLVGWA